MSETILMRFGRAIRKLRRERNISQEKLADLCTLHRTYISEVELGKRNVSLENISRIACALNVSITELFEEAERE